MKLALRAPAKINWFLSVIGKRGDGYHEISSVMQCVSLFDSISLERSGSIELVTDMDLPAEQNLIYKAAVLLRDFAGYKGGAVISLKKNIPSAAGLGGGSSDAAAALLGLNRLWELNLPVPVLAELAGRIGSDVPFFIGGPLALAEGRGERLTPLSLRSPVWLLLVKPSLSVSTPWAYGHYAPKLTKKVIDIKLFCLSLDGKDFVSLRQMVFNDLEEAVSGRYPVIAEIKEALLKSGAVVASMSGSGPTVFGVFGTREEAVAASWRMEGHWRGVVSTLTAAGYHAEHEEVS